MIALTRKRTFPIGLHLRRNSATAVQLVHQRNGIEVQACAQGEWPVDEDAPAQEQDCAVAEGLRKLMVDYPFKGRQVVSCLSASELFVQNVRLPLLPAEEIAGVVQFEAEERLPFPAAEAEIRFIPAGQVRQEAAIKQEVILLGCRREQIDRHVGVLQRAGLVPVAIDLEPSAVLRSLNSGADCATARRAYLAWGESAATLLFAEGEQVLFLKSISYGGRHLDLAVAKALDLTPVEARTVRLEITAAAAPENDDEVYRTVVDAMRHTLDSIATEIELCLRYYKVTFRGKPLETLLVTGSEASEWLLMFLRERLELPCAMGDPFGAGIRRSGSTLMREQPWRWTTAVGLSLRPREMQP
jgi:type IV pilus assembly protein PilM